MKNIKLKLLMLILAIILAITGCNFIDSDVNVDSDKDVSNNVSDMDNDDVSKDTSTIDEYASYTDPFDVAKYIHEYKKLPTNFITKNEAMDLGWKSEEGNLWDITDEMSIGGDKFGNREGLLPKKEGRIYYECDVNYEGGYRGAERIVFSNDGLIFYTDDHYESFTQLY